MSDELPEPKAPENWSGSLLKAFLKEPLLVALLIPLLVIGYMAHTHDDVRAAIIAAFSRIPDGATALLVVLLALAVFYLFREVRACHQERLRDREDWGRWQQERRDMLEKIEALDAGIAALRNAVGP